VLGSQVLEVATGLVLMFFVLALASSSIVELFARVLNTRAKQLEDGIRSMVGNPDLIYQTSVFGALSGASGANAKGTKTRKPSYVSARAFADATVEAIGVLKAGANDAAQVRAALPVNLRHRLDAITNEVGDDLTKIKAALETWFDDTMDRVSGAFKRWSQTVLVIVALVLAIAANASATRVAATLWHDPAVRTAVTRAAGNVASPDGKPPAPKDLKDVAKTVGGLKSLGLPVGWSSDWHDPGGYIGTALGWLLTALLVMLGAPFWYGLLTKLVSLRSTGGTPPKAAKDPASATSQVAAGAAGGSDAADLTAVLGSPTFSAVAP
jgi:hypothetical protein